MVTKEVVGARHQRDTLYLLIAALADCLCAIAGVLLAAHVRFGAHDELPVTNGFLVVCIPAFWCACMLLAGERKKAEYAGAVRTDAGSW